MTSAIGLAHAGALRRRIAAVLAAAIAPMLVVLVLGASVGVVGVTAANAATSPILVGSANYSVLGGAGVTCTGSTTTTGSVGVSPGTSITGFPSPCTAGGGTHSNDASAIAAQSDSLTAFGTLNQTCDHTYGAQDLTLLSPLGPGVYCSTSSFTLSGNLQLTGTGVWIFKTVSTIITSPGSSVTGGDPCNVWWRVGSSATLDTTTAFIGTIIAQNGVTALETGATLDGRVLALSAGTVTLDDNTISSPTCAAAALIPSTTVTHVIDNATGGAPTGAEVTGASFHDTATVSPTIAAAAGTTVTFSFFTNGTCGGTPASTQTVTVSTPGVVPNSATRGALEPGSYSFEATYNGNATYATSTSLCEPFRVLAATPPPTPPVTTPPVTTPVIPVTTPVTPVTTPVTPVTPVTTPFTTLPGGEIIPLGAPQTGAGGASHAPDGVLVALGGVALIGAFVAMSQAIRRRRVLRTNDGLTDSELGEDA